MFATPSSSRVNPYNFAPFCSPAFFKACPLTTAPLQTASERIKRFELLQAGLDLIDQGFTLIDGELRLVAWNCAFLQLLDFPAEMAYFGAPFDSFIRYNALRGDYGPGDPETQVRERVDRARSLVPHDLERARPGGQSLRIRGFPVPGIGFVTLYSDITAQKAAAALISNHEAELAARIDERTAELRRSEAQLRLITDSVPALIAYVDSTRKYRYVNRGYREWFGLDLDLPQAISAREFLGATTYESIRSHVSRAFDGEATTFEYEITRIDGTTVRVRTSLIPDAGRDGVVVGCFELTFDITEQLRAQQLVLKAQKMEALGQLTGGLAHDFNNLLTVVIGNLGLLAQEHPDSPVVEEYVAPALQAARRGVDVIKRLLSFSRRQPLAPRAVNVAAVVVNVSRIVTRSMPESLQLEVRGGPDPIWAWVDASELDNALLNLLLNARDATAGNGHVLVRAEAASLDEDAAHQLHIEAGAYVRLDITDNGCGMDSTTLSRVFEPFFTTKPVGSGTGLGMAMVYGFATQSGGAVNVVSAPDEGATVTLWLPACPAPDEDEVEFGAEGLSTAQQNGLALLVEDDAGVRRVVRRNLLDLGFTVLEAENGHEAREMLERTTGIVLLLSDVGMPAGVDGPTLAREARDVFLVPQVVLMSGHAPSSIKSGEVTMLRKPFSKAQLAAALRLPPP